jgi:hypothetical protein
MIVNDASRMALRKKIKGLDKLSFLLSTSFGKLPFGGENSGFFNKFQAIF